MYKKHKYYSLDTVLGMEHLLVNLYQNYKMQLLWVKLYLRRIMASVTQVILIYMSTIFFKIQSYSDKGIH